MLTELTLHLVDVLLVIMKMKTPPVKIVHTNVSPVYLIMIVIFVKTQPEEKSVLVNVSMDTSMLVFQTVTLVTFNVYLVLNIKITVGIVTHPDKTMLHTVTAQLVLPLMNMVFAKTVNIHVLTVKEKSTTVLFVLISEFLNQTVSVQKDSMIMDITQNVMLVLTSVPLVTILMNVFPVKITDHNNHQYVHVQKEPSNVVKTVCVVIVKSNVIPVQTLPITV